MKILCEYNFGGGGNQGFKYVFNNIYEKIQSVYPNIKFSNFDTTEITHKCYHPGGRCGISSMKFINLENNKTTVLSFWDRTMEIIMPAINMGWEDLNVVHIIGGLGVYESPETIQINRRKKFTPFLYPLEILTSYEFIEKYRGIYNPKERIKKACFIGWIYDSRKQIADILSKHPLFDIYGLDDNLRGESYYKKLSEYAIALSFNGNGEFCLRDVESMGLGIPILRSEMKTPLYKGLYPGVHYIKGSIASENAFMVYPGTPLEDVAYQFIDTIEKVIDNDELLVNISKNSLNYYQQYLLLDNIVQEFFNVFDIDILK